MKKIIAIIIGFVCLMMGSWSVYAQVPTSLPNPTRDFFDKIGASDPQGVGVYNPISFGIDRNKSLKDNIRDMFYPSVIGTNKLRPIIQALAGIIFFLFIVRVGSIFLLNADDDSKIENARKSILYLLYGGFLVFASMWVLRQLNVEFAQGGDTLVLAVKDKIIFNIVAFVKAIAFFVAIFMIIYHGLQIIRAYEKEDKLTAARKGIINVVGVLILIKVIDYVYFIAYSDNFKTKAVDLIVQVSKFFGWVIGALAIIYLIYAGFMLVIGQGNSDRLKKSTNIIKGIFFAALIIFLFLLTMYQLFKDLG